MTGSPREIVGVREAQAFNRTEENIARFRRRNAANRDANVQAVAITSAFAPTIEYALHPGHRAGHWLRRLSRLRRLALDRHPDRVPDLRPAVLPSHTARLPGLPQAQAAVAGAERIYNILDEAPEQDPKDAPKLGPAMGRISFEHVTAAPGPAVLHDVDFRVEPGMTVALVGPTGAKDDHSEPDTALLRRHRGRVLSTVWT